MFFYIYIIFTNNLVVQLSWNSIFKAKLYTVPTFLCDFVFWPGPTLSLDIKI